MYTLTFLVKTVIDLYVMVLLLRIWMQWARCDFYNPLAQFIVKLTQPVIRPLRRVIPAIGPIDTASLLLALVLTVIKFPLLMMIQSGGFAIGLFNIVIGVLSVLKAAGNLVFWVILVRSLMSWVSQGRGAMDYVLIQLTEPLMAPIRRFLPAMGGIDFSAMIVVLILYALNFLGMDMFPGLWYLL